MFNTEGIAAGGAWNPIPVRTVEECDALFDSVCGEVDSGNTEARIDALLSGTGAPVIYTLDMVALALDDGTIMPIISNLN